MTKSQFFVVIVIILFVSGCNSSGEDTSSSDTGEKYRTGTQGLTISFIPGAPPQKVFSDSEIAAIFQVKNKGATDVNNAILYLTGYDKKYLFGTDQEEQRFALGGKSPYNPDGELVELIEFNTRVNQLPEDIDKFKQTIKATLCYSYETFASPSICINPSIHTANAVESVCSVSPVSLSGGQGGPISVNKVEQEMIGTQILFKIYISNHGKGTPYIKSPDNCHRSLKYNEVNLVNIDSLSFSSFELGSSCKPNPIRLVNNNGFAVCSLASSGGFGTSSYITPLNIKLSYNYRDSIQKDFEVIQI